MISVNQNFAHTTGSGIDTVAMMVSLLPVAC